MSVELVCAETWDFQCPKNKGTNLIYVSQPLGDVLKAFAVGDIIDQHDPHCSSVVGGCDCVKSLLSCSVPGHDRNMKNSR